MSTTTKPSAAKSAPKSAAVKPATKRSARKPTRSTKVTPARGHAHADPPQGAPGATARHRWLAVAMRVPGEDSPLTVPYDTFLNEARAEGKGTDEDVAEGEDAADDDTNDG